MNAVSCGQRALPRCPRARCRPVVHQEGARPQSFEHRTLARLRREGADCARVRGARVQEGLAEPARDAQQLVRCSSLMPSATGTGMMPPRIAAQNTSMELLVVAEEQISLCRGARRVAAGGTGSRGALV